MKQSIFILLVELLWYFSRVIPNHIFLSGLVFLLICLLEESGYNSVLLLIFQIHSSSLIVSFNNLFL